MKLVMVAVVSIAVAGCIGPLGDGPSAGVDAGGPQPGGPGACRTYGGTPTDLAGPQYAPVGVAADAADVYFSERFAGTRGGVVMKVARDGGKPVILAANVSPVGRLGVDVSAVYWMDNGNANCSDLCATVYSIKKVPLGGGKPVTLVSGLVNPVPDSLTVDATGVYWARSGTAAKQFADGAILKIAKDGGKPVTVVSTVHPVDIAFDHSAIYWTSGGTQANGYTDGKVMKMARSGGAPEVVASNQPGPGRGLAVSGPNVYWIDFLWSDPVGGTVRSTGNSGGDAVVTLASGQNAPWDVAVDATGIYWLTTGTGTNAGAEGTPEGTVMGIGFDGDCATQTIASKQRVPLGLTLGGGRLTWINGGTPPNDDQDGSVNSAGLP